jgi:hypothetical protein
MWTFSFVEGKPMVDFACALECLDIGMVIHFKSEQDKENWTSMVERIAKKNGASYRDNAMSAKKKSAMDNAVKELVRLMSNGKDNIGVWHRRLAAPGHATQFFVGDPKGEQEWFDNFTRQAVPQ